MKIFVLFFLLISSVFGAEIEIDTDKIMNLLRFPGLKVISEDYTARESQVRNINFKKVAYFRVSDEKFVYPFVIYIAPKGAIYGDKYLKMLEAFRSANEIEKETFRSIGYLDFPDLDNAIVALDQVRMSVRIPSLTISGEDWNAPQVGGLSITATSEELGIDYQIFITGQAEDNPEIMAKFRKHVKDPTIVEYAELMKELIQVVRSSPMMESTAAEVKPREDRTAPHPDGLQKEPLPTSGVFGVADKRPPTSIMLIWKWVASLSILIGAVFFVLWRARR